MFSKASKSSGSERKTLAPSIIASDCRIVGDIVSEGEIQIDGHIEGDVKSDIVIVGEKGTIKGAVTAKTVRVHGSINGQITAAAVELAKTAHVVGDIHHDSLAVAAGAHVEGLCNRLTAESTVAADGDKPIPLPARNASGQALLTSGDATPALGT